MNLEWVDSILTIITAVISVGVGVFATITIIKTRNNSYKQFLEERKKRKLDEKN